MYWCSITISITLLQVLVTKVQLQVLYKLYWILNISIPLFFFHLNLKVAVT